MTLKFAANISFLFQRESEHLKDRYILAKQAGFKGVECGYPYDEEMDIIKQEKEKSGLEQVLINSFPGDRSNGEWGFAALPDKFMEFRESLELSIEYAKALDCKKIHVMSGCKKEYNYKTMEKTYKENILYAADRLQEEGIMALIEPVNSFCTIPDYFMDNPKTTFGYLENINHPNLKYLLDVYHEQISAGNLTANIKKYWPHVGHVQVAQTPNRTEPGDVGELDFGYIFKLLEDLNWNGWIGLEYVCSRPTVETLDYLISCLGYQL